MKTPRLLLMLACAGWGTFLTPLFRTAGSLPNVLFIFSDDHRHDALGRVHPDARTPNLDALSRESVTFDTAMVTTPICSPSRATCLSGMYGTRNGVSALAASLKHPDATVPWALKRAGYRTAVMGKWHLGQPPARVGFDDMATISSNGSWFQRPIRSNIPGTPKALEGRFYERVMGDVVISWMDRHRQTHPEQPFFIWWCTQVPHLDGNHSYPDVSREEPLEETGKTGRGFQSTYRVDGIRLPGNHRDSLATKPPYLLDSRFRTQSAHGNYGGPGGYLNPAPGQRNATLGEDHIQQHQLEYLASIEALDREIGRVLDRLKDPNGDGDGADTIADDTWVIFMGDNGWQTGSHGFTSKVLAYEESIRVPLMIRGPRLPPRLDSHLVMNLDVAPLLYALAGLPQPGHLQGGPLHDLIWNPETEWRQSAYIESVIPEKSLGAKPQEAIRSSRHKLIRTYATEADARRGAPVEFEEFYDLENDPGELQNRIGEPSPELEALRHQLMKEKQRIATTPGPKD